jgi:spermidine synthase
VTSSADPDLGLESRGSAPPSAARPLPFGPTVALFVASGAAGLVDQVCFSKYLSYVVGSTAYAVSAVLAAFMTGLALGAYLGGKWASRIRRPLLVYGVLEVVVALAVVVTPLEFDALTSLYASLARQAPDSVALLSALRWFVALAIVIVPTTAMGATLPILTRALPAATREPKLGALYAANTSGGATGALLAAYVVLPLLGLDGTLFAAAALSGLVGVAALSLGRDVGVASDAPASPANTERRGAWIEPEKAEASILVGLAFLSGFLAFAAEVVFSHLLALLIGNSAYAFGLILAVFLCCLFVGAALASPVRKRLGEGALALGLAATGLALALTLPAWDLLPLLFASLGDDVTTFGGREAIRAFAAFSILCVPTTAMGLTFPLLLQRVARSSEASRWVGRLTSVNTVGAVVGSLGTGYLLLPWLGSERSLMAIAFLFACGALGAAGLTAASSRKAVVALSVGTGLSALVMPPWNLARMTGGSNVYFEKWVEPDAIPYLKEDVHGGVTTVTRVKDVFTLYTNGKFQGNNGWEMSAQRFFAHYPSLFVERFDRALVIGLGTGTTLGTLAAYPWKKIDVVEISPAIVDAADRYFQACNHGAISDPRVAIHHADGRNFVLVSDARYDLIGMELSSIWFAGAASLYSREFYRLVRDRLTPTGVFQQWVQLHHVTRRDLGTVIGTLRGEFKHVALFYGGGQGILVASELPLRASDTRLASLEARPGFQNVLPDQRRLSELTSDVLVLDAGIDAFLDETAVAAGVPRSALVSTDRSLYLEYATPRGNVLPWATRDALVRDLLRFRDPGAIQRLSTR